MKYNELNEIYDEIKAKEKINNEVNYISRLEIMNYFKDNKDFESLNEETKRKIIEGVYYYWVQSYYSIELCEEMARIIMEDSDAQFKIKLRNNAITVKDIASLLVQNENRLNEIMYL